MFNHYNSVAVVYQTLNYSHKLLYICKVKSCCRLVKDVKGFAGCRTGKLVGKLYTLGLATTKGKSILSKLNIAKAYRLQGCNLSIYMRNALEKVAGFVYGHIEYVVYALALVFYFQSFVIKALAATDFALNVYVRQKVHFYYNFAGTLTVFAAAAFYVKAESTLLVASGFGFWQACKKVSYCVKYSHIGCRITARAASDWRLVYVDYLVYTVNSFYTVAFSNRIAGAHNLVAYSRVKNVAHKGGFSTAAYTSNAGKGSKRNLHAYVFKVVFAGTVYRDKLSVTRTAFCRNVHAECAC